MAEEYGDLDLLRMFASRDAWEKYRGFVVREALLPQTWQLMESIDNYYVSHPASTDISWPTFRSHFLLTRASSLGAGRTAELGAIIDALDEAPATSPDSTKVAEFFVSVHHATRARELVDAVIAGRSADLDQLELILDDYRTEKALVSPTDLSGIFAPNDFATIRAELSRTDGLEWRLEDLNRSIGPITDGDLVCVTATPNVGKTRFLASEVTYFAKQLKEEDRRILIFNNEEKSNSIFDALHSAALGLEDKKIDMDVPKNAAKWDKAVGSDSIQVVQNASITTWEAEKIIKQWQPKIVAYNQLYKFHGRGKNATEAEQYRLRYQWAREAASKHGHAAIAIHQAGALAAGEKWLTQEMLYGSKTGVAGECDVIIGLGKTYVEAEKHLRYVSIARNKLPSGPRTSPELREDSHFTVEFNAARSRYETIEFK